MKHGHGAIDEAARMPVMAEPVFWAMIAK